MLFWKTWKNFINPEKQKLCIKNQAECTEQLLFRNANLVRSSIPAAFFLIWSWEPLKLKHKEDTASNKTSFRQKPSSCFSARHLLPQITTPPLWVGRVRTWSSCCMWSTSIISLFQHDFVSRYLHTSPSEASELPLFRAPALPHSSAALIRRLTLLLMLFVYIPKVRLQKPTGV